MYRNGPNSFQKIKSCFVYGQLALISGTLFIFLEFSVNLGYRLAHTIFDVIPVDFNLEEILLFLVPIIGIPSITLTLIAINRYFRKHSRITLILFLFLYPFTTFTINLAFISGGGGFIGSILADIGISLLLFSIVLEYKRYFQQKTQNCVKIDSKHKKSLVLIAISFLILFLGLELIPFGVGLAEIPDPLIPAAQAPSYGVSPTHANTFYILPIWEWQGTDYSYGIAQLEYLKAQIGGNQYTGTGFVKIGRSVSCWYTDTLYPNGSYNPTVLIHTLNLSTITNTPILFHMNGGNWGQCCDRTHPIVSTMRENISNCQWDQKNTCHPIKYNPGPNDRFWSFWPKSEWEYFRERNIKQALKVIFDWWQLNPDLLVGFSTDSEIHLNYNDFREINPGGYHSYFDYNPGTIQQYREWAQSQWSLTEFNILCKTDFGSWDDVDAPREDNVLGKEGNPWWEMWTNFRIWSIKEAGLRQCRWINESGFPREMIWHHQILSEPNDESARYQRCDPLETATNPYCKPGVTRYGWISPKVWNSLGELSLNDGSGDDIPSWGIFEWNLWTQHEYWAYREMLNCIYQYGGHVICPNEWTNCSINEGLWIPGDPCVTCNPYIINGTQYGSYETGCIGTPNTCCCVKYNGTQCLKCIDPHGNPQFIAALQDFIAIAQDYERGTCPKLRVHAWEITYYDVYFKIYDYFTDDDGLILISGLWLVSLLYESILLIWNQMRKKDFSGK